jgi:hypothetical protein
MGPGGIKEILGSPVYQKYKALPKAQERNILTSSWVINGMPAGLCFREDTGILTNNNSGFLPHYILYDDVSTKREFSFKANEFHRKVRKDIYGSELDTEIYRNVGVHFKQPKVTLNKLPDTGHRRHGCHCGGGCPL